MNKSGLIEKMAKDVGITKTRAAVAVESLVDGITEALQRGERVTITGLGNWVVTRRRARTGTNPRTGETIQIEAKKTAKFRPGKNLESRLNEAADAEARKRAAKTQRDRLSRQARWRGRPPETRP